jgi:uncharacterized protein YjbI with pentapeptide repeats
MVTFFLVLSLNKVKTITLMKKASETQFTGHLEDEVIDDFEFSSILFHENTFKDCVFNNVSFISSDFYIVEFHNCAFNNCKFIDCSTNCRLHFSGCKFESSVFKDHIGIIDLGGCNLDGVNFISDKGFKIDADGTHFYNCDLSQLKIEDSVLRSCKVNCSKGVKYAQMIANTNTIHNVDISAIKMNGQYYFTHSYNNNKSESEIISYVSEYSPDDMKVVEYVIKSLKHLLDIT